MPSYYDLFEKKVYIAGRMRGHDKFNFPAFDNASQSVKDGGGIPISPAAIDRAHGFDETDENVVVTDADLRIFMRRDLNAIMDECDAVLVIGTDYSESKGVAVEVALADFLGLEVYYDEEMSFIPADYQPVVPMCEGFGVEDEWHH